MKLFYINWIRRPYQSLIFWLKWKKKWKADQMKGPFPYKITKEDLHSRNRKTTSGDVGRRQARSRHRPPTEHYMTRSLLGFLYIMTYPVPSSLPLGPLSTGWITGRFTGRVSGPVSYVRDTYGPDSGPIPAETTGCVERDC